MRLPSFLTDLSPVGETLRAIETVEQNLVDEVEMRNRRMALSTADEEGLAFWEADYGLSSPSAGDPEGRRAAVRAAMAGGRTLTPACLKQLCVTIGGADRGEVEENFPGWTVTVVPVKAGGPTNPAALERALERLKPAHLRVEVVPCGEMEMFRCGTLHGGMLVEAWAKG